MAYHIVGLDIGSRNVRAVVLERSFRGYEIGEARQSTIAQGEGGGPPTQEAIAAAVLDVVGDLSQGQTSVVCAYPLEKASVWFFTMPFNDPRRIAQTVAFEVEDMVPFDLEDMIFVYRVVRTDGDASLVMATLAPRKEIGRRLETLGDMALDPIALVLDAQSLANAVPGTGAGVRAVLDVGHRRTLLTISRDDIVEHVQVLPVGGLMVTQALAQKWGLPFEVAEHLKHHRELPLGFEPDPSLPVEEGTFTDSIEGPDEEEDGADVTTLSWNSLDEDEGAPDLTTLSEVDIASIAMSEATDSAPYRAVAEAVSTPSLGLATAAFQRGQLAGGMDEADDDTLGDEQTDEEEEVTAEVPAGAVPTSEAPVATPREPISAELIAATVEHALRGVVSSIRAGLIAYEGTSGFEIGSIQLAGGSAALPELSQALSADLGVEVQKVTGLGEDHAHIPGASAPAGHALAFALGLRGVTDGRLHEIDFRKDEFASRGDISRTRVAVAFVAAAVLMLAVVGAGWAALEYRAVTNRLADLNDQIATLVTTAVPEASNIRTPEQGLGVLMEQQMVLGEWAEILRVADDQPPTALRTLNEVSDYLSPGSPGDDEFIKVDIDEYQCTDGALKLKGFTDSFESTGLIQASLDKSPMLIDVAPPDTSVDRRKEDRKNFSITMTVVAEGSDMEDPS